MGLIQASMLAWACLSLVFSNRWKTYQWPKTFSISRSDL